MEGTMREIKIYVAGPHKAGKTTVIHYLDPDAVSIDYAGSEGSSTVGFDYGIVYWIPKKRKLIPLEEYRKRKDKYSSQDLWKVVLVGTPGQERFAPVRESLVRGCSAVAYVVDSADFDERALKIFQEVGTYFEEGTPLVVLANKQDLKGALKGKEVIRRLGTNAPVFETVAIKGKKVKEALLTLLELVRTSILSDQGS
ncbi:MAG TPA: GTP-binding protein [Candidatus Korarchaeota archaeon]|nr:GTP-binding protein [Candidatus Korarchaeota archaeon]